MARLLLYKQSMKTGFLSICLVLFTGTMVMAQGGHGGKQGHGWEQDPGCQSGQIKCPGPGGSSAVSSSAIMDMYDQELAYAQGLVQQAERKITTAKSDAFAFLVRARRRLVNAREAGMRRRFYAAIEELHAVTDLALRGMETARNGMNSANRQARRKAITRLQRRIRTVRKQDLVKGSPRVQAMIRQCGRLISLAGQALDHGDGTRAAELERTCEKLLQQAVNLAARGSETLKTAAQRAHKRLGRKLDVLSPDEDTGRDLVKRARRLYKQSGDLLKQGRYQEAMTKLDLGLSMVRRAERIGGGDLQADLIRTGKLVAEAGRQAGIKDDAVVRQAEAALVKARVSIRLGNMIMARRRLAEARALAFRIMARMK